jgi:hypothetical protein
MIERIILPPGPMMSRILSVGILMVMTLGEDERAAFLGLEKRLAKDVHGQALGLVVHLHGRDAVGRAGDLEVHVAEEVLEALDVGQDGDLVALLDEPHRDAGDRSRDRHAGVHESQRRAADRTHRRGAVGLEHLGDDAQGVREVLFGRDDREERPLSQGTVTDVPALGAAHEARLAGGERREVVVMDVALALGDIDRVDALPLGEHAQREHR